MASTEGRPTRADATRNRDAIIEAALRTLAQRPRASMEEIAAAAGVSRGTLYSHFRSRRTLVATTVERVLAQTNARLAGLDPSLSPADSLLALVATSWRVLGDPVGIAAAAEEDVTSRELRRLREDIADRLRQLLLRGRDDGSFRADQTLNWQVECISAIVRAGAAPVKGERLPRPVAAAEVATTLRAILRASPAASGTATSGPHRQ